MSVDNFTCMNMKLKLISSHTLLFPSSLGQEFGCLVNRVFVMSAEGRISLDSACTVGDLPR